MGLMDDIMEGVEQPPKEETTWEKAKTTISNIPGNVKNSVYNYLVGAQQGLSEQWKQERALNQIAAVDEYGNATPREGYTQQQVNEQRDLTRTAQTSFSKETIAPPLGAAAIGLGGAALAAPAAYASSAGVTATAYLPFLGSGMAESYNKGGIGQVARDLTYGGAVDWYNQPELAKQFQEKPVSTTIDGVLGVAPMLLIGAGAVKGYNARGKVTPTTVTPTAEQGYNVLSDMGIKPKTETTLLPHTPGEQLTASVAENASKEIVPPTTTTETAPVIKDSGIISAGEQQLGKPYQLGADGTNATDCGKFTQDVMSENGINLDYRTADGQYLQMQNEGKTFSNESQAQIGDLVFFDVPVNRGTWKSSNDPSAVNSSGEAYKGVTHVGIYAGDGKVLQAGSHGVSYADINAFGDIVGFAKTAEEGKATSNTRTIEPLKQEVSKQLLQDQINADSVDKELTNMINKSKHPSEMSKEEFENIQSSGEGSWKKPSPLETQTERLSGEYDGYLLTDERVKEDAYDVGGEYEVKEPLGDNVTLYRVVPKGINEILPGEFTSASKKYVEDHLANHTSGNLIENPALVNGGHILKITVPKNDVFVAAANELIWAPKEAYKAFKEKYPDVIKPKEEPLNHNEQGSFGGYSTIPAETTYAKPVTRAEIIKDVNELIPARAGRVGAGYEGLYKGDPGVIRSKAYGDIETLSHEVGHYIDSKLKIAGHDAELIRAADNQWNGNKAYEEYTPEQRRAEGIAEFGRQYMINKAEALNNFPGYGKDFVTKLVTDKKLSQQVENISNKMRAWHAQSPEARARGGMSFGYENEKTFIEQAKNIGIRTYENWVYDKVGLTRLVNDFEKATGIVLETKNNPEKLARLANNSANAKTEILVSERNAKLAIKALNAHYNGALIHDVTITSIIDRVSKEVTNKEYPNYLKTNNFKNWSEAFDTYLIGKRQIEIQEKKTDYIGSMSKSDAKAMVDKSPKQFSDIAQDFYDYNDNLMRLRVEEGLTSAEEYQNLKDNNLNYAHMSRSFEDTATKVNGRAGGKGFGNISDPMKRLSEEGSGRSVISPIESAISDTSSTLHMIERNRVAQAFVKLSDVNGAGRFVEKVSGNADAKNSIFTIMVDGKKQAYQTEPEYYRAIMSVEESTATSMSKLLRYPAKWLRAGAVLSPEFFSKNIVKDTLEAYVYSKNGFVPVIDTARGVFAMFKNEDLYNEYKSSGAMLANLVGKDRESVQNRISDIMQGKSFETPLDSIKTLANTIKTEPSKIPIEVKKAVLGGLQWVTDISETGTKLGEYMLVRKSGKSITEAALAAQEIVLNFSRHGIKGQAANQAIPFFNAAIQGTDKMAREFYKDPKGISAKIATAIVLPTVVISLLGLNDQEIQELPQWEKDTFWIVRTGDKLLRIPKPLGLNVFSNTTEEIIRHMYDKNPESIKKFITNTAEGFLPNLMPTAMLAIVEWAANYSFFRDKQIVPQALQNSSPEKQYNTQTSETAKSLGNLTGTSPMKLDNAFRNLGGGLAGFGILGADNLIKTMSGNNNEKPAKTITEQPVIKAFFSTNANKLSQSTEQFYTKLKELEQDHADNGKKGIVKAELQKYRHANTELQDVYKKTKEILGNDKFNADEKRTKTDSLQQKHNQIILKALGK
jgi:cell wall-associated NlpC family hydrolase